jgi:hypothetical protein
MFDSCYHRSYITKSSSGNSSSVTLLTMSSIVRIRIKCASNKKLWKLAKSQNNRCKNLYNPANFTFYSRNYSSVISKINNICKYLAYILQSKTVDLQNSILPLLTMNQLNCNIQASRHQHKANSCIVQQSPFRNPRQSNLDTAQRNQGKIISNSIQNRRDVRLSLCGSWYQC